MQRRLLILASVLVVWQTHLLGQKTSFSGTAIQSDAAAITTIQRAIAAMGGQAAWESVGAATAQLEVSSKGLPTRHVNWSDDWSSGYDRTRRDAADQSQSQATVATRTSRTLRLPNGTLKQLPTTNDIAVLAVGYPAVALSLSLLRADCAISTGQGVPTPSGAGVTDQVIVIVRCTGAPYPGHRTELTWTFSSTTGLPLQVLIPIGPVTVIHPLKEQVEFTSFQSNHGLLSSSEITKTMPDGHVDHIHLTLTTFSSSLSDQTFDITK